MATPAGPTRGTPPGGRVMGDQTFTQAASTINGTARRATGNHHARRDVWALSERVVAVIVSIIESRRGRQPQLRVIVGLPRAGRNTSDDVARQDAQTGANPAHGPRHSGTHTSRQCDRLVPSVHHSTRRTMRWSHAVKIHRRNCETASNCFRVETLCGRWCV